MEFLTPLSLDELRSNGVPDGFSLGLRDRVRFGETDMMGHVNNASYLSWAENIRIAYFKQISALAVDQTPRFVIRQVEMQFLREMFLNEDYIIACRCSSFRRTSFVVEFVVVADDIRVTGSSVIVSIDGKGGKSPLPDAFTAALSKFDDAQDASIAQ